MRFQPLMEVVMRLENKDPKPPMVPKRNKAIAIKVKRPIFLFGCLPERARTKNTPANRNPKAPINPREDVAFSLTNGVDELY